MPFNTTMVIGGTKRLECRVVGHPRPKIRWFKDGRDITHNARYHFDHTYEGVVSMVIENICHNDEGNYRCRAENSEGLASTAAYLLVKAPIELTDEEIEEVHAMELDEHFLYCAAEKTYTREKVDMDAARKRTFEQIVDEEKENARELLNRTVSKEISAKKSSQSSLFEEQLFSKKTAYGYEEAKETSSKKTKTSSEKALSVIELGVVSEQERYQLSESSTFGSSASVVEEASTSSFSTKSVRVEESSLTVSASTEKTKIKAKTETEEAERILKVAVEKEQSSYLKFKEGHQRSLEISAETEESKRRINELSISAETVTGETSGILREQIERSLLTSVEIDEKQVNTGETLLTAEVTSEISMKTTEESNRLTADIELDVPEACRLELKGLNDSKDLMQEIQDNDLVSLCTDSGFADSSMQESSQFQAHERMLDRIIVDSDVDTIGAQASTDQANVSGLKDTKDKSMEESHVDESKVFEAIKTTSAEQQTETALAGKKDASTSAVKLTVEEVRFEEKTVKTEKTSVSQEISYADKPAEIITAGDITGLLDEKPDSTTLIEEEVIEDVNQQEQRARWVDQITSRTETSVIEGEGKKVDAMQDKDEQTISAEKLEDQTKLSMITEGKDSSLPAEGLVVRKKSAAKAEDETSELVTDVLDENDSGSSVDTVRQTDKENEEGLKEDNLNTEETRISSKTEDEPKISAETVVGQVSAPRIVSVPDDVSVEQGQDIHLTSQVQGNPQPEVKWFKEGDSVKPGERITLHAEDDVFTLEIRDVEVSDSGTYTLTAHNSQGTIFSDVLVTVSIPPSIGPSDEEIRLIARLSIPEFVVQPGKVTVKELGTMELVCTIKANPSPTVVWSKDGKTLDSDSHMSIFESEGQYYFKIPRTTVGDAGDYVCTASNSEGSVSCTITVLVESQGSGPAAEEGAAAMVPLSRQESSSDDLFLLTHEVICAYEDEETGVAFKVGEIVEILDSKQKNGMWLVRKHSQRDQVCFIPSSCLKDGRDIEADGIKKRDTKQSRSPINRPSSAEIERIDTSEDEDRMKFREKYPDYVVIADYNPGQSNGEAAVESIKLTEGQIVEVLDMERSDRWLVQTRPTKTSTAKQGWVPPAYLEAKTSGVPAQRRSTREVFREDVLQIANKQQEATLKRRSEDLESEAISAKYAVTELVESEREYVRDLKKLLDSYYKRLGRRSTPADLKEKRDLIFSNISDIMDFHNDVFLQILEASVANPGTIGDSFLVKDKKFNMYITYWMDQLSTKVFVETEEAQDFLREYSRSIGDSELTFPRLLECPISRLSSYQTLLKDILRYTARAGHDCSSLEKAIAMLAGIELQVKQAQLLQNVEGLPGDASSLGQLIRHDDVILWDSDVGTSRGKDRHLFLFKDKIIITKRKKGDSATDQPSFVFKGIVELQNVQVNENVTDDDHRFELWYASATSEKYTLHARTVAAKQAWLKDTRELLKALGIEETDIMPEKLDGMSSTQAISSPVQKKIPAEKPSTLTADSGSESDRTVTDGDYASLSSYDESDISSYHTAPEFEDGSSRPIFKKRPKKTVCQEGSTVKFDCIVGGTPLPTVQWLKDGAAVKESDWLQVTSEGDTSTLTLQSVGKSQAGQYSALAANHNGSILAAAELLVLEELGLEKAESVVQEQETRKILESKDKTSAEQISPISVEETATVSEEKQISTEVEIKQTTFSANREAVSDITEEAAVEQKLEEPSKTSEKEQATSEAFDQAESTKRRVSLKDESQDKEKLKPAEELQTDQSAQKVAEESSKKPETSVVAEELVLPETKTAEEKKTKESELVFVKSTVKETFIPDSEGVQEKRLEVSEPTYIESKKPVQSIFEDTVVPESKKVEEEKSFIAESESEVKHGDTSEKAFEVVSEEKKLFAATTLVSETRAEQSESVEPEISVAVEEKTAARTSEERKLFAEAALISETRAEQSESVEPEISVAFEEKPALPIFQERKLFAEAALVSETRTEQSGSFEPEISVAVEEKTAAPTSEERKLFAEAALVSETRTERSESVEPEISVAFEEKTATSTSEERKLFAEAALVSETRTEQSGSFEPEISVAVEEKTAASRFDERKLFAEAALISETRTEQSGSFEPEISVAVEEKTAAPTSEERKLFAEAALVSETRTEQSESVEPEIYVAFEEKTATSTSEERKLFAEAALISETRTEQSGSFEPEISVAVEEKTAASRFDERKLFAEAALISETRTEQSGSFEPEISVAVEEKTTAPTSEERKLFAEAALVSETTAEQSESVEPEISVAVESKTAASTSEERKLFAEAALVSETRTEQSGSFEPEISIAVEEKIVAPTSEERKLFAEAALVSETRAKQSESFEPEISVAVEEKTAAPISEERKLFAEAALVSETRAEQSESFEPDISVTVEGKSEEPTTEEKKLLVEETFVSETRKTEKEKVTRLEPTPSVEETKTQVLEEKVCELVVEEFIAPESTESKKEQLADLEPSLAVEEKKPSVLLLEEKESGLVFQETIVPESREAEGREPERTEVGLKKLAETKLSPSDDKVAESEPRQTLEKTVIPESEAVAEEKKPVAEEGRLFVESDKLIEDNDLVEDTKAFVEQRKLSVEETVSFAEEKPVKLETASEKKESQGQKAAEQEPAPVTKPKPLEPESLAPEVKELEPAPVTKTKPLEPESLAPEVKELEPAPVTKPKSLEPESLAPEVKELEPTLVTKPKLSEPESLAQEVKELELQLTSESTFEVDTLVRPPHFLSEMNDVVVEMGQLARFDCRVAAYPDPVITWFKDGHKVVPTDRYVLQNFHDDIFSLLIKEVKTEDSGYYTCHAKNEYGEAKTEALLNVLGLGAGLGQGDTAPSFATKFGNVECIEGVPVEFTCQIKGHPTPTTTWLLNGREVVPSLDILTRQQEDTIMLAFRSAQLEYSGDVVCKLKNHLGEATCRAKLLVSEDLSKKGECPLFVERPSDMEVTEGGEARFECVVTGTPEPEVLWYFNGRELFDSRRRTIRQKGDKYQLILREVIPDNAGVYTCKAVNAAGDASCAVELSVKEIPKEPSRFRRAEAPEAEYSFPPTFTRRLVNQTVAPGRSARFECYMLGIPLPEVEWQKNGRTLKPSGKVRIGREGSTAILEIDNADLGDAGEYTCILTNDSGKATSKAGLTIQEERKPRYATPKLEARLPEIGRAPSRGRDDLAEPLTRPIRELSPEEKVPSLPFDKPSLLDVREDSVKLGWLPARTTGLPDKARHITYTLEARELPSNQWVRLASGVESTSYVARNLRPNKEYMFRVYAENKYGPSEPTLPATLTPREEPEYKKKLYGREESPAPMRFPATKPFIMDIGAETLRLGWHPAEIPRRADQPPISYRVEAQKLPSEEWIPLASRVPDTSLYLSDLEPNRDYNIRVRAQGPFGVSQPTAPVWLPRAPVFSGVPVSRPDITELEPDTVRLQWRRVDVPSFTHEQDPLTYMIEMQEPPSTYWREVASHIPDTYYIIHDLEPRTDYRFRVRAQTREGLRSEPSPATSIHRTLALSRTPIDQVEIVDYDTDYQTVGLRWQRVEVPPFDNEEEPLLYMIECQEPQSDMWRTLVSGVPTTHYRIPDIGPAEDYKFRVRALTPYGLSPPSHPTSLYRSPTPSRPLASDLYISSLEPESMRLSWQPRALPSSRASTPSAVPSSYLIEALEYPSTQWRPLASDVRDTSYQLTGLAPTKDYSFRVRAMTPSGGLTAPTPPVTVTSLPVRPRLPSKEPVIKEMGADSVRLQWPRAELPYYRREAVPISYSLEMQEIPGYTWIPVRSGIPETSYLVTGLRADRDYRFRVRPETEFGPGEYSRPVQAYRKPVVSLPMREPSISDVGPNNVTLSWLPAQVPSGSQSTRPLTYRLEMREPPSGHWVPVAERVPSTRYTVNFLNPDKDYSFRVFAELDGVESEPTASAYLPHRMGPPKMLREPPYISSVHPDSVWLSWRSVDIPARITDYSPVTYRIEAQEPPHTEWRPVARHIPTTHYHLTGLKPGQEYNFRIRAENDIGLSEPTPSVLLQKRAVRPTMPLSEPLISDVAPGSLRLSWRPAEVPSYLLDSLPVTYSIHYQHLPDSDWHPLARRIVGTSYYVTGLSPDNNYTFRVQAENQFGSSKPTHPARMPRLAEIPAPIYSPEIEEVEPSALRLAWKMPWIGPYKSKKTTYSVEALEPSTWTWRPVASNLPTPSYRVPTLSPTQDYVFRVRAEADKQLSEPSFPITYSRSRAPLSVPVERPILSETEPDSVLVSWRPISYPSLGRGEGSRKYRLEMRELPYGSWSPIVHSTPKLSYEVTGLRPNMDYSFRVSAITDSGVSAPSNASYLYRRPVIPRISLEQPELAEFDDDSVSLRWKRVDIPAYDADDEPLSFMIEAQRLPSYDWEPVARGITDTSYKISGLKPKEDYVFRVRGELPSGITTPSTPIPLYRCPERAGVPVSNVTVDDRNVPPYSARLHWKPVYIPHYTFPTSTLYQVEMKESAHRDWRTLSSDVRGTEFVVSDLSPRKTYMFRVRARSPTGGLSEPSIPVPFYPLYMRAFDSQPGREIVPIFEDYSVPNRPYIHTLIVKVPPRMHIEKPDLFSINPTTVHLNWNAARVPSTTSQLSPTTYRVEVREDGTFNWVERASNITGLGCDIGGLNPHRDYAFRVRAVNDFGWSESTLPSFLHRPLDFRYDEPDIDWGSFSPTVPPLVAPRLPIDSPRITPITSEALKLSWQPARTPAYARKSPITYVVEMKEPSAPRWSPVASRLSDTSYQVSGLEPVRPYLFRVRAESEFGSSEPTLPAELGGTKSYVPHTRSQSVERQKPIDYDLTTRRGSFIDSLATGVPPRVPYGRPTISNVTETSLTLSWPAARMPAYLKNTKVDYIVETHDPASRQWVNLAKNIPDTNYKITGLDPNQDYMFRVRAHNDYGTSEPTLPVSLERPKKATIPQRRGSSVERRSLDQRSIDRLSSDRGSLSRSSLDRRSESGLGRKDGRRKDRDEVDTLSGQTPDDSPLAPEFSSLDKEDVQYGVESHPMTVSLHLRGYPPPQVTWYHQGKKLELGDRYDSYVTPSGQVFLEFLNMGWRDVGDYKCVAENDVGKAEKTVKIDIADPPTFIEPLRDITVVEHGQGVLSCSVDGIPYPSVRFMKDWRPLTQTSRLVTTNDKLHPERWTLTINDALSADSGSYMCVAENVAGKVFSTGRVNVDDTGSLGLPLGYKDSNLEDNYYVLEELGRGRHGRVRRVIEKCSGKEYAAKFVQVREPVDKEFFRSELDMLCRQKCKDVVSVHDAYETPRQLITVTELLPGGELVDRIVGDGSWTEGKAAGVVRKVLEILQHVHSQGIVHMDIKPSNLLLSGDTLDSLKLIDFGFARKLIPSQDIFLNHGTPGYASPEALEVKPISTASDVWGVGVLAYILLGGQSPFQADTVGETLKKIQACDWSFDICKPFSSVSEDAKDFISRILKKNSSDRPTVNECLAHPWLKNTTERAKIDVGLMKAFQERDKQQRQKTATKTVVFLRTLQRQLAGVEATEKGLRPTVDPQTGSVNFPDIEAYGEFLDAESWFDWQSRYGQGPESGLLPLKDPEYTARIRGYKRSIGSLDDDDDVSPADRERIKIMKERKKMVDIDKEEIPPSLEKELQWLEGRQQAKKAPEPQRRDSIDSRRSSISTDGDVTGQVPVFRQRLQNLTFQTGDTITMYCALEGLPPYSTVWYRNEELLSDGSRIKQELSEDGQATLTITAAKPYDAGVYKCVARNKTGRASSRMRLLQGDVPERPGRPVVLQVEAQEAVLIWEAPRSDGNCPIRYYKVDCKARGDQHWTTATYTTLETCLVTDLKPETAYRMRVSAANLLGQGPYSWATVEVTTKKQGSVVSLATGDLDLELLKQRQQEAKEIASRPRDPETVEEEAPTITPTLQLTQPDTEYVLGDILWKGRFGELRECTNKKSSKRCLMKCIPNTVADSQREFDILKTIHHETVLRLLFGFSTKSALFLVFEHAPGEHVAQCLSLRRRYSEENVACVIRQVLHGLQYLHRNSVVHLNLQPSSVLLISPQGLHIKLADFSLAHVLTNGAEEVTVPRKGYPDFIPPEVVVKGKAMLASDVWGVGTLTFLLLSGLSPFSGRSDEETLTNIAYNRYDAGDLLDGVSNEALKFLFKIMKLLPRNRLSIQDCLEHKWLLLTDAMTKTRESNLFRSNRLRQFVLNYDRRRQSDEHRLAFDDLVLPSEMVSSRQQDVQEALAGSSTAIGLDAEEETKSMIDEQKFTAKSKDENLEFFHASLQEEEPVEITSTQQIFAVAKDSGLFRTEVASSEIPSAATISAEIGVSPSQDSTEETTADLKEMEDSMETEKCTEKKYIIPKEDEAVVEFQIASRADSAAREHGDEEELTDIAISREDVEEAVVIFQADVSTVTKKENTEESVVFYQVASEVDDATEREHIEEDEFKGAATMSREEETVVVYQMTSEVGDAKEREDVEEEEFEGADTMTKEEDTEETVVVFQMTSEMESSAQRDQEEEEEFTGVSTVSRKEDAEETEVENVKEMEHIDEDEFTGAATISRIEDTEETVVFQMTSEVENVKEIEHIDEDEFTGAATISRKEEAEETVVVFQMASEMEAAAQRDQEEEEEFRGVSTISGEEDIEETVVVLQMTSEETEEQATETAYGLFVKSEDLQTVEMMEELDESKSDNVSEDSRAVEEATEQMQAAVEDLWFSTSD